jgi:hypothetical protein
MSDKCIVSFASKGRENYNKAQLRMIRSCVKAGWDGDYMVLSLDGDCDEYQGIKLELGKYPGIYNHAEIPYGFKPDIIKKAADAGYRKIIWADSTICMAKIPTHTLAQAAQHGVAVFHNLGHPLWNWISDKALNHLGYRNADLTKMEQIMACVLCFDLDNPMGLQIFNEWYAAAYSGVSFQDYGSDRIGYKGHRHDQAILSVLCYKYNIPMLPYGWLVYQPHDSTGEFGRHYEWINKGVDQPL